MALQDLTPLQKAKRIRISEVNYVGIPLEQVLRALNSESIERDPERKGVKITLAANAKNKASTVIKMKLGNATLAQVLAQIAQKAGLSLVATDNELTLASVTGKP